MALHLLQLGLEIWRWVGDHPPLAHGCGSKPMGSHFRVGEFTLFRTYFSGDWDVHWGYGLLTHGPHELFNLILK